MVKTMCLRPSPGRYMARMVSPSSSSSSGGDVCPGGWRGGVAAEAVADDRQGEVVFEVMEGGVAPGVNSEALKSAMTVARQPSATRTKSNCRALGR